MIFSTQKQIAIVKPVFQKLESKLEHGIARITQRLNIVEAKVLMHYRFDNGTLLAPGDYVLIRGDMVTMPWAQTIYVYQDMEMVMCPESAILGYRTRE